MLGEGFVGSIEMYLYVQKDNKNVSGWPYLYVSVK